MKHKKLSEEYIAMVNKTMVLIELHCKWLAANLDETQLADQVRRQLINLLIILKPAIKDLYNPVFNVPLKVVLKYEQLYDLLEVSSEAIVVSDDLGCSQCCKE